MKKGHKILLRIGIAVVIFLITFTIVTKIVVGSTKPAYLHIESGSVEVNTGSGWQTAEDGMSLSKKDSVRTGENGEAIVILYDSSFINLEPNTEITIEQLSKSNTKVKQDSGETWNKFSKITGMSGYEVETPNTVATIRGTEFLINADEEKIIVVEGIVDYKYGNITVKIKEFEKYIKGEKLELTAEEKNMLLERIKKGIEIQKEVRANRMDRMRAVDWARKNYVIEHGENMSKEEQLRTFLDAVDQGKVDDRKILKKIPLINKHPSAKQFIAFNDEIKEQEERLRNLKGTQKEKVEQIDVQISDNNVVSIEQ